MYILLHLFHNIHSYALLDDDEYMTQAEVPLTSIHSQGVNTTSFMDEDKTLAERTDRKKFAGKCIVHLCV